MSILVQIAAIAVLLAFAPSLEAAPKRKKAVAANAQCESTGESTKKCTVTGNSAELHLNISRAHPVIVTLDELPSFTYKDPHIAHQVTERFVLFKLRKDRLPKGHNLLLRTETMTITLFFHAVDVGGDSQVHIERADRAGQDVIVENRVAEKEEELEKEYARRLEGLEQRAQELARKQFLHQVFHHGSQVGKPTGDVRSRHDFLVLRATDVIRIGNERILQISIEERKGSLFSVGSFTASVKQGGATRALNIDFRCTAMQVRPSKTVRCSLALGEIDKRRGRARVSLRVEGADGQRTVGLDGVDIL